MSLESGPDSPSTSDLDDSIEDHDPIARPSVAPELQDPIAEPAPGLGDPVRPSMAPELSMQILPPRVTFSDRVLRSGIIPRALMPVLLGVAALGGSLIDSLELCAGAHSVTNGMRAAGFTAVQES